MDRRKFITGAGLAGVAGIIHASAPPAVHAQKRVRWKMVTTWGPGAPGVGEAAALISRRVKELTSGKFQIKIYGAGQLVPALGIFDAVTKGTAELGHSASYYWAGKVPAAQFFAAVPWGMNPQQVNAWLTNGNGQKLWDEVYKPFGIFSLPAGNTGIQMGGWLKKEITTVAQFKGLKMRIPGLGGKAIARMGANVVLLPGVEVFTALERGTIDGTEWIGPFHDKLKGLHQAAKFYYYPGWHEPGTVLEMPVNIKAHEKLPKDYQVALRVAAAEANLWTLGRFDSANGSALNELVTKHGVKLRRWSDELLKGFYKASQDVYADLSGKDKASAKVLKDYQTFQKNVDGVAKIADAAYLSARAVVGA
ncbi:MAG: ABC transporter substrate-binding protein [Nitrospinaceae bacterium]|jgi:TRAP-type mannitol/chloroaromatic compound transport system substrate-binding protein|nr:ABC transporter substrate-binding protein [Nitrospinaceae bacterium]MBT3434693.1 ABC transporter substrate-binding protein [Nitrospinaceae bacterium]MBT3822985.1 ABC transporter substrate-binding protein [Nitrospinaceae bacterium]MBT4095187.1 ABC transporter substrate-binding protein [Nitrospinaceae bacterium]MBT4430103.1 ABC transporter substrate-binding protein [Nitrospinaceae bacterium]